MNQRPFFLFVSCFLQLFVINLSAQTMPHVYPGDTIAIIAPACGLSPQSLQPALDNLRKRGYYVLVGDYVTDYQTTYAGNDAQRATDVQRFLDDPSVKVLLCARGGYGSVRIIDQLDFSHFREHPKWVCGFSDVTVFLSHLAAMGFPSVHSVMPITMRNDSLSRPYVESLLGTLRGEAQHFEFAANDSNRVGMAEGDLVGGNLSILYSLLSSQSDVNFDGKILFIEDTEEYLYHIDRMMRALDRAGKLRNLQGLIVGCVDKLRDTDGSFGQDLESVVRTVCADYDFPICFDFPAGHCGQNFALRMGMPARLAVQPGTCVLEQPAW